MKKILIIVFIILVVLILLTGAREIYLWNDGNLNTKEQMTREEILALLEKGKNNENYYYCSEVKSEENLLKTEHYIKNGIMATYVNNELTEWTDKNNSETIKIWKNADEIFASIFKDTNENLSQAGYDYSVIAKEEYKYLGKKEQDDRTEILIQITNKNFTEKFVIDEETGLIIKQINLSKKFFVTESKTVIDRNVKLNVVTEENIAKPDISNYKVK